MTTYETIEAARRATDGQHVRIVCTCGVTLSNCRCSSPDKYTVAVRNGCGRCAGEAADRMPRPRGTRGG